MEFSVSIHRLLLDLFHYSSIEMSCNFKARILLLYYKHNILIADIHRILPVQQHPFRSHTNLVYIILGDDICMFIHSYYCTVVILVWILPLSFQ